MFNKKEKEKPKTGKDIFDTMFINTKNIYKSIAVDGLLGDIHSFSDMGCHILNALVSGKTRGGAPDGKIVALAGEKGVGKTFIILEAVSLFLQKHPKGAVFFYESESAITKDMMIGRGIDVSRVFFFPVSTVESWRNQQCQHLTMYNEQNYALKQEHLKTMMLREKENAKAEKHNNTKAVKDGKKDALPIKKITDYKVDRPLMMVLDSVGNLNAQKEFDNALEDSNKAVMSLQRLIKSACRLITQQLSPFSVPMLMSSHVYVKMDGSGNVQMSGGSGPQFTASVIVYMSKKGIYDDASKSIIGNIVTCHLEKGRLTKERIRCDIQIMFKTGLNRFYGLVRPGAEIGAIEKGGAWYTAVNGFKVQGESKLYGDEAPQIFDEQYLDLIDKWAETNYCYGSDVDIPPDDAFADELDPEAIPNQTAEQNIDNI